MDEHEEKKAKIVKLVRESAKPRRKRATAPRPAAISVVATEGNVVYVNAKGDAQVAGRDININTRKIERNTITPPPGSLTPAQARRIQVAIEKMVEIEAAGGVRDGDRSALFAKWHKMLKDRYGVPSYLVIPAARAVDVLAWLRQIAAMNRPKLRRTDVAGWRNEHYKAIWARSRQIGLSKGDVYALVFRRLEKQVLSLKSLSDASLRKLYQIIMAQRPA